VEDVERQLLKVAGVGKAGRVDQDVGGGVLSECGDGLPGLFPIGQIDGVGV
jgi:hypothetical protein